MLIQASMCKTHNMYWPDKIRLIPGAYVERCPMSWTINTPCELEYREMIYLNSGIFDDCVMDPPKEAAA